MYTASVCPDRPLTPGHNPPRRGGESIARRRKPLEGVLHHITRRASRSRSRDVDVGVEPEAQRQLGGVVVYVADVVNVHQRMKHGLRKRQPRYGPLPLGIGTPHDTRIEHAQRGLVLVGDGLLVGGEHWGA